VDPLAVALAVLVAWVLIGGVLALAMGRAVAVARVREHHDAPGARRAATPERVVTTTPGRTSIVRSR
jgi:hypothetical protein